MIRSQAEKQYVKEIESAYDSEVSADGLHITDAEVPQAICDIVTSIVGSGSENDLSDDTDLFSYGADSVACIQIRLGLARLVSGATALPPSVVEDSGTIARLADFIIRLRSGQDVKEHDNQLQLMSDLVKEYSVQPRAKDLNSFTLTPNSDRPQVRLKVLLTGPTGSLGSHLLHQLLQDPRVEHIYLLVRGAITHAAHERVTKTLSSRGLTIPSNFDTKTTTLSCKLSSPSLGPEVFPYEELANNIDLIIHLAWSVNFLILLRSIAGTHLAGLQNLLRLALASPENKPPPRLIFCSSVAAVSNFQSATTSVNSSDIGIPEQFISDPHVSGPTSYACSKWVGEAICAEAHKTTRLKGRISVTRVGQLSGATDTGIWSKSEAYPLLLSSMKVTGALPELKDEILNWLPVDLAAQAFVEACLQEGALDSPTNNLPTKLDSGPDEMPLRHVLNHTTAVRWADLVKWLVPNADFKVVPVDEWLEKLGAMQDDDRTKDHPALRLLTFWRNAYESVPGGRPEHTNGGEQDERDGGEEAQMAGEGEWKVGYQIEATFRSMPILKSAPEFMDEAYVLKLWKCVEAEL